MYTCMFMYTYIYIYIYTYGYIHVCIVYMYTYACEQRVYDLFISLCIGLMSNKKPLCHMVVPTQTWPNPLWNNVLFVV